MHKSTNVLIVFFLSFFSNACTNDLVVKDQYSHDYPKKEIAKASSNSQFTFSWPYTDSSSMKPRGGTTLGQNVTLDKSLNKNWLDLTEKNLTDFERDRLSILAMTGAYRVSFDFIETLGLTENYLPTQPYQSWGTEYVYLVEDKSDFISLQHILVMFFSTNNNDDQSEPIVVKHWRQDWKYQDKKIHVFTGFKTWEAIKFTDDHVKGKWSQSVYQVDDSPRYQAIGKWIHNKNFSSWLSNETWRPLPRREFSVRDDYNVLIGTNRHTITPTGWVQEEENLKAILTSPKILKSTNPILAKEIGVARYERIIDHDWSAGDNYWKSTLPFWKDVRNIWNGILGKESTIKFNKDKKGLPLYITMFNLADESKQKDINNVIDKGLIKKTIESYLTNP